VNGNIFAFIMSSTTKIGDGVDWKIADEMYGVTVSLL